MLRFGPGLDGALFERQARVGNHEIEVEADSVTKTLTSWTGSIRVIETEKARFGRRVNRPVILAFKSFGKSQPSWLRLRSLNQGTAVSFLKTYLQRVYQALTYVRTRGQSVYHDVYILKIVELVVVGRMEFDRLPFKVQTCEAALHQAHNVGRDRLTGRI